MAPSFCPVGALSCWADASRVLGTETEQMSVSLCVRCLTGLAPNLCQNLHFGLSILLLCVCVHAHICLYIPVHICI